MTIYPLEVCVYTDVDEWVKYFVFRSTPEVVFPSDSPERPSVVSEKITGIEPLLNFSYRFLHNKVAAARFCICSHSPRPSSPKLPFRARFKLAVPPATRW